MLKSTKAKLNHTKPGFAMLDYACGTILSQNVHFVTILTVPLTGMGVLYPRVQDFFHSTNLFLTELNKLNLRDCCILACGIFFLTKFKLKIKLL